MKKNILILIFVMVCLSSFASASYCGDRSDYIFCDDFENNSVTHWTNAGNNMSIYSDDPLDGLYSLW